MIRFLADENFNGHIVAGLKRRLSGVEVVRVQDIGLNSTPDRKILEYAASDGRVVLTHDADTMVAFAYDLISSGAPFAGLVLIQAEASLGQAIEDLHLLCLCSADDELQGQVVYLTYGKENRHETLRHRPDGQHWLREKPRAAHVGAARRGGDRRGQGRA